MKRNKKNIVRGASFIMIIGGLLGFGYQTTRPVVALTINGEAAQIKTNSETVAEFFDEQNIYMSKDDISSHTGDAVISNKMNISIKKAKKITLVVDGVLTEKMTNNDTVQEVLDYYSIETTKHDKITPAASETVTEGMSISVEKARAVDIKTPDTTYKLWTRAETIKEMFKEAKIVVNKADKVSPALSSSITNNMTVKVVETDHKTKVFEKKIPFKIIRKNDSSLSKGNKLIVQSGKKGIEKKYFNYIYEDGRAVEKVLMKREVETEAQDKIIHIGTKVDVPLATNEINQESNTEEQVNENYNDEPFVMSAEEDDYKTPAADGKSFYVTATAYTAYCTGCSGTTKIGIDLRKNPNQKVIAVDPKVIPLGSTVWVEGMGYYLAGDTGGAIKGDRIDIFMEKESDALIFGRRVLKVKVME